MTPSLVLTDKELHNLTGYQKPGRQIAWLRKEGFTFRVAADGHPRVDRSHYLKLMGGSNESASRKKSEPNFDNLMKFSKAA